MANEIIKGAGSHHIALMASDFEKSLAFYKALGFKEVARWGDEIKTIAMLDIGSFVLKTTSTISSLLYC